MSSEQEFVGKRVLPSMRKRGQGTIVNMSSMDGIASLADERLDVVVHNAGHMVYGPTEAFTPEQLTALYDINVLSTQRVNRAALPQFRKQRRGLLVWVSSSSTRGGTPPYLAPTSLRRRAWIHWR
jgi:NADP-dependent 3-hydroxy acid dehydrogenase YdfG